MTLFSTIGFTAPWLLLGLLALPMLWILLRVVPPAPTRRVFPGVALLLGLKDDDVQSDKTPWWLLLLRALVMACWPGRSDCEPGTEGTKSVKASCDPRGKLGRCQRLGGAAT
jgi:hypothetical protein